MSQTTDAISSANFKVEVSDDGSTWTDISGANATVSIDGGDIGVGSQHTAAGAEAIVVSNKKRDPLTISVKAIYTETADEPWKLVRDIYESDSPSLYLRFSPAGGATGDLRYTTAVGGTAAAVPIKSCGYPQLDAGSEDLAMFEFAVMTPGLKSEAISA